MRRAFSLMALALIACGAPPTRAERTVVAPQRVRLQPAVAPPEPTTPATSDSRAPTVSPRLREAWLEPLRRRELTTLAKAFSDDCALESEFAQAGKQRDRGARKGRDELLGWLHGHVLAFPYTDVRPVYVGPSARPGVDVAEVELLDACGRVLATVTAKLRQGEHGYEAASVRVEAAERVQAGGCSP